MKLNSAVKKHSKKTFIAGAAVAVAAAGLGTLGAGLASGSVPAANGTITGCYPTNASLKTLYLIDPSTGATCPQGDTQITFNQSGLQGPIGATGPAGPAGPPGPAPCPSDSSASPTVMGSVMITSSQEGVAPDRANIYCFDQGVSAGSQTSSGGAGTPTFSTMSITKDADAASVHLFNDLTSGTAIAKVQLVLYQRGTTTPALSYQFVPVKVTSDEVTVVDNTPLEKVTFTFGDLQVGAPTATGGTSSAGWSQATNSPDPFTP